MVKREELWLVDLNPTRGQEIQKTRPVIVISSDFLVSISMWEITIKISVRKLDLNCSFEDLPYKLKFIKA